MYLCVWDTDGSTACFCLPSTTKWEGWESYGEKESRKTKRNFKQEKEKEKKESERHTKNIREKETHSERKNNCHNNTRFFFSFLVLKI